jgi:hypothetical protein
MIASVILAVPERTHLVAELQDRLGIELPVHLDIDHVGHATAYRDALDEACDLADRFGVSHAMVIEDDAWPCRGFLEAAELVLHYVPETAPVTYFTRRRQPPASHWLKLTGGFINTQACAWPVVTWRACSSWMGSEKGHRWASEHTWTGDGPTPRGQLRTMNADNWFSEWLRRMRQPAWATVPSLVEHRPGKSTLGHNIGRATSYIGSGDPLWINWSRGAPVVPVGISRPMI